MNGFIYINIVHLIGYISAILIGLSLVLIGSGGTILTLPVMVYLLGISPLIASSYSLFVVGITSIIGSIYYIKRSMVNYSVVFLFSIPSIVAVYFTRVYLLPLIPDSIVTVANFTLTKNTLIMLLFAVLMLIVFFTMTGRAGGYKQKNTLRKGNSYFMIIIEALAVGVLTGIIGVGGGFMIIPSLVILLHVPMKKAIGSSLLIITINCVIGFLGSSITTNINWQFLVVFTAFSVAGITIGLSLSKKISNEKLRPLFGWFVLITGLFIITKEIFFHL